jgi:hypothetical protein
MRDRPLIATGVVGGALAAICCATPLLAPYPNGKITSLSKRQPRP